MKTRSHFAFAAPLALALSLAMGCSSGTTPSTSMNAGAGAVTAGGGSNAADPGMGSADPGTADGGIASDGGSAADGGAIKRFDHGSFQRYPTLSASDSVALYDAAKVVGWAVPEDPLIPKQNAYYIDYIVCRKAATSTTCDVTGNGSTGPTLTETVTPGTPLATIYQLLQNAGGNQPALPDGTIETSPADISCEMPDSDPSMRKCGLAFSLGTNVAHATVSASSSGDVATLMASMAASGVPNSATAPGAQEYDVDSVLCDDGTPQAPDATSLLEACMGAKALADPPGHLVYRVGTKSYASKLDFAAGNAAFDVTSSAIPRDNGFTDADTYFVKCVLDPASPSSAYCDVTLTRRVPSGL